jgi:hypothetical protein
MKLPTLNVDVAVNTKTMQKGIAEAQKNLEKIGKKGLSFAGGTAGKLGGLAELGGGFGSAAIGIGGIGLAIAAPFKAASIVVDTFTNAVKNGEAAVKAFAAGTDIRGTGLNAVTAATLASGKEAAARMGGNAAGWIDSATAAAMNEQGQMGGVLGFLADWGNSIMENGKYLVAATAAVLGGKDLESAMTAAEIAVAPSTGAAQSYLTSQQINAQAALIEKQRKQERETNT